jgi:hypothetical protein
MLLLGNAYLALVTPFTKKSNRKCLQYDHDETGKALVSHADFYI